METGSIDEALSGAETRRISAAIALSKEQERPKTFIVYGFPEPLKILATKVERDANTTPAIIRFTDSDGNIVAEFNADAACGWSVET